MTPLAAVDPEFSGLSVRVDRSYYLTTFSLKLQGKHTFKAPLTARLNGVVCRFANWQDERGTVLSRSTTFTYNIQTSKTLYAVYMPPHYTFTVYVYDATTRKPIAGAVVRLDGGAGKEIVGATDSRGRVVVSSVYAGTYQLSISKDTYRNYSATIKLTRSTVHKAYLIRLA